MVARSQECDTYALKNTPCVASATVCYWVAVLYCLYYLVHAMATAWMAIAA